MTDALGNRLTLGSSTSYSWDALNRMTSLTKSGTTTNYEYRADGMRTHKLGGSVSTEYVHDGQMPVEDSVINGSTLSVTRYGLGARGMDYMEKGVGTWTSSTSRSPGAFSTVAYPLYDAHGNMIATISRGSTTLNDVRTYDAWGGGRQGSGTGDPKNRYCASLGHQQDDESGLIYMRARYYEPGSGRFVSEDSMRDGVAWFSYCGNDPVGRADSSGAYSIPNENIWAAIGMGFAAASLYAFGKYNGSYVGQVLTGPALNKANGLALIATACFTLSSLGIQPGAPIDSKMMTYIAAGLTAFAGIVTVMAAGAAAGSKTAAGVAVYATYVYGLVLIGELLAQDVDGEMTP